MDIQAKEKLTVNLLYSNLVNTHIQPDNGFDSYIGTCLGVF